MDLSISQASEELEATNFDCLVSKGAEIFTHIVEGDPDYFPDRLLVERNALLLYITTEGEELVRRVKAIDRACSKPNQTVADDLKNSFNRIHKFILPRQSVKDMKNDTTGVFPLLTELINLLFSALAMHLELSHADRKSKKSDIPPNGHQPHASF